MTSFIKAIAIALCLFFLPLGIEAGAGNAGHCRTGEQEIFRAVTVSGKKTLSICASDDFTATSGYVQYRFGRIGDIELEAPEDKSVSHEFFTYEEVPGWNSYTTALDFIIGRYGYSVYDMSNGNECGCSEDAPDQTRCSGIQVLGPDSYTNVECGPPVVSKWDRIAKYLQKAKSGE